MRALALLVVTLSACATPALLQPTAPPGASRTIIVDEAFTEAERDAIVRGARAWWAAAPELGVLRLVSHRDAWAFGTAPYAIHVVPVRVVSCDVERGRVGLGCFVPPDKIELAAADLDRLGGWESVPAHEFGHALGLTDVDSGLSVMRKAIQDQARGPTAEDVRALRDLRETQARTEEFWASDASQVPR